MPIPQDFQKIMLPFLEIMSDDKEHETNDVIDSLAGYFKLT
jgi:restriction endonuclease Mrr